MAERPILFSAPMVRALLAGTKTQTRRICKAAKTFDDGEDYRDDDGWPRYDASADGAGDVRIASPYGAPGDRLWVRETWGYRCSASTPVAGQFMHTVQFRADEGRLTAGPMPLDGVGLPMQRDRRAGESWDDREAYLHAYWRQWRPSIHMPRWASRITLEVTSVRVERLQEISEADALAESIVGAFEGFGLPDGSHYHAADPRVSYWSLWDAINGAGSVEANPWVWVIEFQRHPSETLKMEGE